MSSDNQNRKTTLIGVAILFLTALIWGFAFVAQRYGVGYIDGVSMSGLRYIIASFVLGVTVLITDLARKHNGKAVTKFTRGTLVGGAVCGVVLFVSTLVQQMGIETTTAGKAGFITTLYIVMVPIINLMHRKRTSMLKCCAIMSAVIGFVLMCVDSSLSISQGDGLVLYSAVTFGFHIVFIDMFCKDTDPSKLTFIQFATCAVLGIPAMAINGFPTWQAIGEAIVPILYIGVLSSGVAYTLQAVGQKRVESSSATLIMSLESVVSLIGGVAILHEQVSGKELAGCVLVLVAVFVAQMKPSRQFLQMHKSKYFVD